MKNLLLALFICSVASLSLAAFREDLSVEYMHVAAASFCPSEKVATLQCGPYCDYLRNKNYRTFFTRTYTKALGMTFSFSMFYNPTKKLFATAFRGTQGATELTVEILKSYAKKYDLHAKLSGNPLVQAFFYDTYKNVFRKDLLENIKKARDTLPADTTFLFTGHSLGAAMSVMSALDAKLSGLLDGRAHIVYNYGCPRVGNSDFAKLYDSHFSESYRVIHYKDLVPRIPPCVSNPFTGKCAKSNVGKLFWFPWHVNNEVYYKDEKMTLGNYSVCKDEDPTCANQYDMAHSSTSDHTLYYGIVTGC